ncbi:hypothetical protein ACHAWO_007272 [Cyclotella atomus]|uniref:Non-haem dioxygenase N-terminal domain-containing protein n=1 Tax=Cyclotella atomus TaxID=382360 RepID=A0ABD3MTP0_9STRA
MNTAKSEVVTLSYDDLVSACKQMGTGASSTRVDFNDIIDKAFGSTSLNSLGIIAITDVPNLLELRLKLLPMAEKLATLSSEELDKITAHDAAYQVGWSHGREKLEGDKPDLSKGSFYANPLTDDLAETMLERRKYANDSQMAEDTGVQDLLKWDASIQLAPSDEDVRKLAKSNPAFFAPNIWPTESIPELEATFKDAGELVHSIGTMIAKCCDSYVSSRCPGYKPHRMEEVLRHSKCCKARLLHYFAMEGHSSSSSNDNDTDFSNWCGWHNDHGSITGLFPALYIENGQIVACPDPQSGLYIKSRSGKLVHAELPPNSLAFQIGETSQVHTGGLLQATPHAVRGCSGRNVTRESFAVFMEPEYHSNMDLPEGRTFEDTQCAEAEKWLPPNVRTLKSRWKPGMNFGEFSNATFAAFH